MAEPSTTTLAAVSAGIGFASLFPGIDGNALIGAFTGAALVVVTSKDLSIARRFAYLVISLIAGYLAAPDVVSHTPITNTGVAATVRTSARAGTREKAPRRSFWKVDDSADHPGLYCIFIQHSRARDMPKRALPAFGSPTIERLRELYRGSDDDLVRCTVLEVVRLRELIVEIDGYRETVEKCWRDEGLGQLVALYQFRILMQAERSRTGHSLPPNPSGEN